VDKKYNSILDIPEGVSFDLNIKTGYDIPKVEPIKHLDQIHACPRCNKPLVKAACIDGDYSESFLECPECGTLVNTFKPTTFQAAFLKRSERYKMTAGGFGSGKSRVDIEDVIKHLLLIPNARVCIAARTYPALEATFIKDFYAIFPKKLLRSKNETKHEMSFTNGSELLFRSFDDPKKLKSLNLTMAVIIEGSDVLHAGFEMMQSRIRNSAAMIPEYDAHGKVVQYYDQRSGEHRIKYRVDARHINIETNPDAGWVKAFLLDSAVVQFFGDAYNEGYRYSKDPDKDKYSQVVSTSANPYLPENYEEEQTRNKSKAYIQQFFKGSFNFSTNLVVPNVGTCIVAPHKLPEEFDAYGRRTLFYAIGLDYGIGDPTHVVFCAFSSITKKLYVFAEMRLNNSDVRTISKAYRKEFKLNHVDPDGLLMLPRFDGRSYNKRESDLHTIGGAFEAEGLYFEPSFANHEIRIIKLNSLVNHGQLEIYSTCEFLIEELLQYKFKLDRNGNPTKTPVDGKDHGITALEFVVVDLPHNLEELKLSVFIPQGTEFVHDKNYYKPKKKAVYDPLKKEEKHVRSTSMYPNRRVDRDHCYPVTYAEDHEDEDEFHDVNQPLKAYIPGRD
jgi:phage FluMu protein Com